MTFQVHWDNGDDISGPDVNGDESIIVEEDVCVGRHADDVCGAVEVKGDIRKPVAVGSVENPTDPVGLADSDDDGTISGEFRATGLRPSFLETLLIHGAEISDDAFHPGVRQ